MIIYRIAKKTGLDEEYLNKVIQSASHRYKIYKIPKRTGGFRQIAHPSIELKLIQKWLVDNIFSHFPVHNTVYSYRTGRGIRDLATIHKKNNYLLKVDFQDFFSSINGRDVLSLLHKRLNLIPFSLSRRDFTIIRSIVCRQDRLTIGAPSSPAISNTILYDFDTLCNEKAQKMKVNYSRYADDIYFSTNQRSVLGKIFTEFKKDLRELKSPRLFINEKKTVFSSKKYKRVVTGLVITPERNISIGRKKKRHIKSMVYKFAENQLSEKEISYLKGFLAYVKSVDPAFLTNLRRKYGIKTINAIFKSDTVTLKN